MALSHDVASQSGNESDAKPAAKPKAGSRLTSPVADCHDIEDYRSRTDSQDEMSLMAESSDREQSGNCAISKNPTKIIFHCTFGEQLCLDTAMPSVSNNM